MIGYLIGGVLTAMLLLALLRWWSQASTSGAKAVMVTLIIALCAIISLVLIAAGKGILAIIPSGYALFRLVGPWAFRFLRSGKGQGSGKGASDGTRALSRREALDVLGLKEGATEDEIRAAHRRMIANVHPDKGGSDWMAAKINEARKTLLDED